jgi:hypothetical protein
MPYVPREMIRIVEIWNPKTGEKRQIKVGWSWVLFFFSGFLGIPLFLRHLNVWGAVFLIIWALNIIGFTVQREQIGSMVNLIGIGLCIWLGVKGNEMTAKNYLQMGWMFVDPDEEVARLAKVQWGLSNDMVSVPPPPLAVPYPPLPPRFFFVKNNKVTGPASIDEIKVMVNNNIIDSSALLWKENTEGWKSLRAFSEFNQENAATHE